MLSIYRQRILRSTYIARCETTETSIAQCGITLLIEEVLKVLLLDSDSSSTHEAKLLRSRLVRVPDVEVQDSIVKGAAHEPLNGQVIDTLGGALRVV